MFGNIPFLRYLIFFLAGIFCREYIPGQIPPGKLLLSLSVLSVLALLVKIVLGRRISGALFFPCFILLGVWVSDRQSRALERGIREVEGVEYDYFQVRITSPAEKRPKALRFEGKIESLISGSGLTPVDCRALIYFPLSAESFPEVGDRVLIKGRLRRPPTASSEFSFDYRNYLERQGILWMGYANKGTTIIPGTGSRSFSEKLLVLSGQADKLFRAYIRDDRAYGLVKAMILGRRDAIDPTLNAAFINSGTVHVLSVSGLHIVIFFSVLHFVFSPFRKGRLGEGLYLGMITLILSAYAVITGLPASVQRATVMCIVWMFADAFGRKQSSVNTLALTAFGLLMADPNTFYDIGFQLSFLAMLGIFLFYQPLSSLYEPSRRLTSHIWNVSMLSVSAQLMTFPLVTYYFHQFPTYFLVANILVVDLAGLLIPVSLGFLVFGLSGLEWLTTMTGNVLELLAQLVNFIVEIPQSLPYFLLTDLFLDKFQMILLLALLLLAYGIYQTGGREWVYYATAIAIVFCVYSSWMVVEDYQARFVKSLDEGRAVLLRSNGRTMIFTSARNNSNTFLEGELKEYVARYGSDTLRIPVYGTE